MGQQSSSHQAAAASGTVPRSSDAAKKPKTRKSTFSKLKLAALNSVSNSNSQANTRLEDMRLIRVRRKSFPYSHSEEIERQGVLVPPKNAQEDDSPYSPFGVDIMHTGRNSINLPSNQHTGPGGGGELTNLVLNQVINWEHLPETMVTGGGGGALKRSNVWSGGSGLFDIEEDESMLQAIAAQFTLPSKSVLASSKTRPISVLDPRRTMKISLAMKRMGLDVKKFPKLIWALRDVNESYLTQDAVEILFEAQVWASPMEAEDIKTKIRLDGGEELLANEDLLLWYLVKSVPDCGEKVTALNFRYDFDNQVNVILQSMIILRSACAEIISSQLLKRLLRVVLFVGNSINTQPASGIALQSLMQLNEFKSPVQSDISFLDCIVAYLDTCAPEVFEVADEVMLTEKAACDIAPLATQAASIRDLKKELMTKVKPIRGLAKFYDYAMQKISQAERDMVDTKLTFEKTLEHFCLSPTSMDNVEFFGTMFEFLEDFADAITRLKMAHEMRLRRTLAENKRATAAAAAAARAGAQQTVVVKSGLQNAAFMNQRRTSVALHQNSAIVQPRSAQARLSVFGRVKSIQFKDKLRPLSIGKSGIPEEGDGSSSPLSGRSMNRERPSSGRQRPISLMMSMHELQDAMAAADTVQEPANNDAIIEEEDEGEEEDV